MKKILYIGNPDEYTTLLQTEIRKRLPDLELVIQQDVSALKIYEAISDHCPSMILINYQLHKQLGRKFFVMIRKSFGDISIAVLSPTKQLVVVVEKISTLGDNIYWIKNPTINEIIDYLGKKLGENPSSDLAAAKAYFDDDTDLYYSIRVSYMGRTHAQIETNRYFPDESSLTLDFSYLADRSISGQHKLSQRSTNGIYSHYVYSYHVEYEFQTNNIEPAERSKFIKNLRYEISTKPVDEKIYAAIIEATKEKKSLVLAQDVKNDEPISQESAELSDLDVLLRTIYFNWLIEKNKFGLSFKDTFFIYDESLEFLKKGLAGIEKESVNIIYKKEIQDPLRDMISSVPSLIAVNLNEKNTIEKVKEMISGVTQLKDQFPFIILFNYKGNLSADDLRHKLEYHFVLSSPDSPDPYIIIRMMEIYRKKQKEKESTKAKKRLKGLIKTDPSLYNLSERFLLDYKLYKDFDDPGSILLKSIPARIVWMSETEIMIKTKASLTAGEIFRIKKPFDLQVEILSQESQPNEDEYKHYITHMHFLSETDKLAIKGFVQEIQKLNKKNVTIFQEELEKIKNQFFPFNFVYNL